MSWFDWMIKQMRQFDWMLEERARSAQIIFFGAKTRWFPVASFCIYTHTCTRSQWLAGKGLICPFLALAVFVMAAHRHINLLFYQPVSVWIKNEYLPECLGDKFSFGSSRSKMATLKRLCDLVDIHEWSNSFIYPLMEQHQWVFLVTAKC